MTREVLEDLVEPSGEQKIVKVSVQGGHVLRVMALPFRTIINSLSPSFLLVQGISFRPSTQLYNYLPVDTSGYLWSWKQPP